MDQPAVVLNQFLSPAIVQDIMKYKQEQAPMTDAQIRAAKKIASDKLLDTFTVEDDDLTGARFLAIEQESFMELLPARKLGLLEEGASGQVLLTQDTLTPDILMAAKRYNFGPSVPGVMTSYYNWRKFRQEVSLLQVCEHANIVKFYTAYKCPTHAVIFMEFCHFGSLDRHMDRLNIDIIRTWFIQMADAVNYLHFYGIAHRDIKLENILVREDKTIALSDFDLAEVLDNGRFVMGRHGTVGYMAPEVLAANKHTCLDGIKADSFSLGIVLLLMVIETDWTLEKSFVLPDMLYTTQGSPFHRCLVSLLAINPSTRADVNDVLCNPDVNGHIL